MRVDAYNSFAANTLSSGAGNISTLSCDNFPFDTKTEPKMSDEEYKAAIIRQAQKDAPTGKFGVTCSGFRELLDSYVSVVSPDRKGIITSVMNCIAGLKNPFQPKLPKILSLLDVLTGKKEFSKDQKLTYAEFKDSNGEVVASYCDGKWEAFSTKAEDARNSEFYGIYKDAWNAVRKGKNTVSSGSETISNSVDIKV